MDASILEDLGLSKGEINVYLTLLKIGTTKVGSIIEKSGMASSAVHNAVNQLVDKGLISFIKKGQIKFYSAAPPKQILSFIDEKKEQFQEVIPELEAQTRNTSREEAEVFEGIKGVTTMLNILIEEKKRRGKYMFFTSYGLQKNREIQDFFEKYDMKRRARGMTIRGLAPPELKFLFTSRKMLHMRYPSFPIPLDISMYNNQIALISWGEKPIGYLIKSKELYDRYAEYFEKVWEMSKA
jgi:sugar-specific transcriptional regulator TrmB